MIGLHHIHERKRKASILGKILHNKKHDRLDKIITIAGIGSIAAGIPQIYQIYSNKDATAISAFLFGYYALFNILMLYYGVVHKHTPVLITYTGNTIINSLIFIGSLIY